MARQLCGYMPTTTGRPCAHTHNCGIPAHRAAAQVRMALHSMATHTPKGGQLCMEDSGVMDEGTRALGVSMVAHWRAGTGPFTPATTPSCGCDGGGQ